MTLPPMGLGTNKWRAGKVPADGRAMLAALVDAGAGLVDTAEVYGAGSSERAVGASLAGLGGHVAVVTKFMPLPWRRHPRFVARALRGSLGRLGLECVDLYLLHFGDRAGRSAAAWMGPLADQVHGGRARAIGLCNVDGAGLSAACDAAEAAGATVAAVQVAWSLADRTPERDGLVEVARARGVTVMAHTPLGKGAAWAGPVVAEIASAHGATPPQVALAWLLAQGGVPIPGTRRLTALREDLGALDLALTDEDRARLDVTSR